MKCREMPRHFNLERLMGVEPTYAAWEAAVLPMNYSRVNKGIIADSFLICNTKNGGFSEKVRRISEGQMVAA